MKPRPYQQMAIDAAIERAFAAKSALIVMAIAAVSEGIKGLLSGVLVGSWTAFETLATDVWVEAVNQRPMSSGVSAWMSPQDYVEGR